jgi:glyoxylase-like metal-dependent hydrolase (beta-lactamase superfamily II)
MSCATGCKACGVAALFPHGRLVEVPDSDTLIPLDQPARLAQIIRGFRRPWRDITETETLTAGLERLGYYTGDVASAVISHLHQDHIGGISEISHADLLVSADEWRSLHRPMPEPRGLLRAHIELDGAKWTPGDHARAA